MLIDVEIIPGNIATTVTDENTASGLDQSSSIGPDGLLGMGMSIGDPDGRRVRTLGGLVTLHHNDRTYKCALTSSRATRSSRVHGEAANSEVAIDYADR